MAYTTAVRGLNNLEGAMEQPQPQLGVRSPGAIALTGEAIRPLQLGDAVFLNGLIFTGREGVHQQIFERGLEPPFDIRHSCNVTFHRSPGSQRTVARGVQYLCRDRYSELIRQRACAIVKLSVTAWARSWQGRYAGRGVSEYLSPSQGHLFDHGWVRHRRHLGPRAGSGASKMLFGRTNSVWPRPSGCSKWRTWPLPGGM